MKFELPPKLPDAPLRPQVELRRSLPELPSPEVRVAPQKESKPDKPSTVPPRLPATSPLASPPAAKPAPPPAVKSPPASDNLFIFGILFVALLVGILMMFLASLSSSSSHQPTRPSPSSKPNSIPFVPEPSPTATPDNQPTPRPTPVAPPAPTPFFTSLPTPTPYESSSANYRVIGISGKDRLNVRSGPGTSYPKVAQWENGTTAISVLGGPEYADSAHWYKVARNGVQGWVNGQFISDSAYQPEPQRPPPPSRKAVFIPRGVHMELRYSPEFSSRVAANIPSGSYTVHVDDSLTYTDRNGLTWLNISIFGYQGWVTQRGLNGITR